MMLRNNSTDITSLLFYLKPPTLYVYIYSVRRSYVWFLFVGNVNFMTIICGKFRWDETLANGLI